VLSGVLLLAELALFCTEQIASLSELCALSATFQDALPIFLALNLKSSIENSINHQD